MYYYYVIYEDEECETYIRKFDNASLACGFIERKLETGYYGLCDFTVVHGIPFSIQQKELFVWENNTMYYIIYENDSDYETTVVSYKISTDVVDFIENKINKHNYNLNDFSVVQGAPVNLKAIKTPVQVVLTN